MSLLTPCSGCASRLPGKLANLTWAWYRADQTRKAYRMKLCIPCYAQRIVSLGIAAESGTLTCPNCGIDTELDMDPMFCTMFVPGGGKQQLEMATCAPCAAQLRAWVLEHSSELDDGGQGFGGQDPGPQTGPQPTGWDALGLRPR